MRDVAGALPAKLVSDELGRFRAIGLAPGKNGVAARTSGFAPWSGSVEVPSSGSAPLEIVLGEGVTLLGTITDAEGSP